MVEHKKTQKLRHYKKKETSRAVNFHDQQWQKCFRGIQLPCEDVLQCLHQSHLFLSSQRRLEKDLRTAQTLRPNKQLVVFSHVEHRLQIKVTHKVTTKSL